MAYAQMGAYANLAIAKNGTLLVSGTFTPILLSEDAILWCNSNLYGTGTQIYSLGNIITPNANYTAITYSYTDQMSEYFSAEWIFSQFTAVNDYIDIYNTRLGPSFALRIICTSIGATYCDAKLAIVYPGGTYTAVNGRIYYDYYSNYTGYATFTVLINADEHKAALFRLLWANYIPATASNSWSIFHDPPMAAADFNTYAPILYAIFSDGVVPPEPTSDPYADGGYSTQDGGGGDFDDTSDPIALPSTPNLNLSLNHFISAYVPSINDINDLADWIWGNYDKFDSNKVLGKLFTEPMDSILSLHMLPFTPASSTAIAVTIGNFATGLTMKPLTLQFTDIDCGSLTFSEYWGNYLDYNPYTKIVLCLPFVGQVDLDADEVMGKSVSVKYRVDNLTGAFVCFVYIDSDKILGQYSGECMLQVPVTAGSYAAMNAAIATIACTAAASFGGATAAAIGGGYGGMIGVEKGLQMGGQALGETLASGASNVNGMKLQVSHSGALTGTAGFLGAMTPYAIIHRPRQCVPEHYNELAGYPSNITKTLGDCEGFTSVRTMVYNDLPFTDGEILALDSILKGGIFI